MPNQFTKNKPAQAKRAMTVNERENLKEYIGTKEELLKATEGDFREGAIGPVSPREASIQKEKLKADINHLQKVLDDGQPEPVKPKDEGRLVAERDALRNEIIPILETREEIEVTNRYHLAWSGAIKKAQLRPRYEGKIARYKELCKRLEPDNPFAGSLDEIRRDK